MSQMYRQQQEADSLDEWDNFCRLCFADNGGQMVQLFPQHNRPDRDLLWKILECATLKLTFDEDSSAQICHECIQKMTDFCDYRMECLRNDKRIKTRRSRKRTASEAQLSVVEHKAEEPLNEQVSIEFLSDPLDDYDEEAYTNGSSENLDDESSEQATPASTEVTIKRELQIVDELQTSSYVDTSVILDNASTMEMNESINQQQDESQLKKKRIRKVLQYDGFFYLLLSSRPKVDSITWGCYLRKSKACRGTITTKTNGLILGNVNPVHNHAPIPLNCDKPKSVVIQAYRDVDNVFLTDPYEVVKNRIGGDVLIYQDDRYPYSHSRKDGCRIWKCGTHRKCTVSIYLCPDGRIFKQANAAHTEEVIPQKRNRTLDGEQSVSDISSHIEKLYPNPVGTFNYKIAKNANKRNVLIYEGDRYSFYYRKSNGWFVWRCTMSKACQAMIYQLADESVVVLGETVHNHLNAVEASF